MSRGEINFFCLTVMIDLRKVRLKVYTIYKGIMVRG